MSRVDGIELDYRLVRRAFGPYKLPDDQGTVEEIGRRMVFLLNAMPEQPLWVEALLPLELQQKTWRESVVELGWPENNTGMYRVTEIRQKVWQAVSKQVEPLNKYLVSLERMGIPRKTYDYGSLGTLLGLPRYVIKAKHKRIDHGSGNGLLTQVREQYMSHAPALFDYLFLEGDQQFREHLSHFQRHVEDVDKVSEPLRAFVLRYMRLDSSELAIAEELGTTRQWINQLKGQAFELFGVKLIGRAAYMRRIFRFPAAEAWRAMYAGMSEDEVEILLAAAQTEFHILHALLRWTVRVLSVD